MSKSRSQKHEGHSKKCIPPLYTAPEMLRAVALALDTKGLSREVGKAMDEYVSKGQYVHDTHCRLLKDGVVDPISIYMTPETKRHFIMLVESFVQHYHALVVQFPCYDARRGDVAKVAPLLCVPLLMDKMEHFIERLRLPALDSILAWSNPVGEAITWLKREFTDWEMAVKDFTIENGGTDYIERWATGALLPSAKSLLKFIELIKEQNRERIIILLIVARAFAYAYRMNSGLRDQIVSLYSKECRPIDSSRLGISAYNPSSEFEIFMTVMSDLNVRLQEENMILDTKSRIQSGLLSMSQYHRKSGLPLSSRWFLSLVKARTAVVDGQLQLALDAYKKAFSEGLYSAGETQIEIIDEALCVASMQSDMRFMEKLKNQAIGFGMIEQLGKDHHDPRIAGSGRRGSDFVEDWEIKRWRERYNVIFPASCRFINASGVHEKPTASIIIINQDKHLEPDLKHPNRVVQYSEEGGNYRIPQIHWFALRNDVKSVKRLIERGADYLTPWKDDGSSVFHIAIRKMGVIDPGPIPDDSLFQVVVSLLEEKNANPAHRSEVVKMIKTPFLKRQTTVLGSAVETCRPDVVKAVLGLGAPADQRHTISRLTPLYWLCQLADNQRNAEKWMQNLHHSSSRMSSAQIEDANRRYGVPLMPRQLSDRFFKIEAELSRIWMDTRKNINRDALITIARILLENGADANASHSINGVKGRTPLMLAIESNDLELFNLMMEFGGDIKRTCLSAIDNREYTCLDIARCFGAGDMLGHLERMSES